MGAGPALRLVRTAVFAAVCVLVSGLGHALSSGGPLPPRVLALVFLPVCGAGWLLSRRERGAVVVVGASAAGQLLLHVLFSGLHPSSPPSPTSPQSPRPHGDHAGHGSHGTAEMPHEGLVTGLLDSSGLTPGMLGAHLLAGLVCGLWLWRGDHAFGQLVDTLRLFAYERLLPWPGLRFAHKVLSGAGQPHLPVLAPPVAYRPVRPPAQLPAPHVVSRRGPPLLPSRALPLSA